MIYLLRATDGVYVGSTVRPKIRLAEHRMGSNATPSVRAWVKQHGFRALSFEIVATCVQRCDRSGRSRAALDVEQVVIQQLIAAGERVVNVDIWRKRAQRASVIGR